MLNVIMIKFIVTENVGDCEATSGVFGDDMLEGFKDSGVLSVL